MKMSLCRHMILGILAFCLFGILPASANTTNTVPFSQSFENFSVNQSIIGTQGWHSTSNTYATVTNLSYSLNSYPIAGGHDKVVRLDTEYGAITNIMDDYDPVGTGVPLFLDTAVLLTRWTDENPPDTTDPEIRFLVYANSNGQLVVVHDYYDTAIEDWGTNNIFTVCTNYTEIGTSQWVRLTLTASYIASFVFFQVQINGAIITNAFAVVDDASDTNGTWFAAANSIEATGTPISEIALAGTGFFDDFVMTTNVPNFTTTWLISSALNYLHGATMDPPTSFTVENGCSATITVSAAAFWTNTAYVADGVETLINTNYNYVFAGVVANHSFTAKVAQLEVTSGSITMPQWWLNQYGLYANPVSDNVTDDLDLDGQLNWEEWLASTDPNDTNSVFEIARIYSTNNTIAVEWVSTCVDPLLLNVPFRIDRNDNLTNAWSAGYSTKPRVAGTTTNVWVESSPDASPAFYRIAVTN